MAAVSVSTWVPVIKDTLVAGKNARGSAIFQVSTRRPMTSTETDVPRWANADLSGGDTLTDDSNSTDTVSMFNYLYNGKITLSEAEVTDSPADAVEAGTSAWMRQFAKGYDNACIGVTAARSGTASNKQPYTSVYKAITTNDNSGAISYSASTNLVQSATSGGITYSDLSSTLSKVEANEFWDPAYGVVIMHPGQLSKLRLIVDGSSRYVFQESTSGDVGGGAANLNDRSASNVYHLFGIPVYLSYGAKTSSSFAMTETGNQLIVFADSRYLVRGDHTVPQARFIPASINTSALQHTLQLRARQGFVLTIPFAAAVLEARS